jgi:cbb3-type cytochrome oxidase maturation protein
VLEFLTFYEFLVALLMALAGLAAFLWATTTGGLRDVEAVKHRVLDVETDGE